MAAAAIVGVCLICMALLAVAIVIDLVMP
jgi:hypothetical protein